MKATKNTLLLPVTLIGLCLIKGCASIAGSHTDTVSVETPACLEATCKLTNDDGTYFIKETPGSIVVERAYGDLNIICSKGKYMESLRVESKAKGVWGNILLGGIIGWGVDATTGAGYEYPNNIIHPLKCPKKKKRKARP